MSLTNKVPEKDVNDLFTRVAPNYDVMNNVVSLGVQNIWRYKLYRQLNVKRTDHCLDLCCGTGDSTISLAERADYVVGLDFNKKMLAIAHQKIRKKHLQARIRLVNRDAMQLPFAPNSFDLVTICFGLRNVPDAEKTIKEVFRVLKPHGKFAILEMSQPTKPLIKIGWHAYFKVFPYFAKLTKSKIQDYQYLSKTSKEFLTAQQLKSLLVQNGFQNVKITKLTFGAGAIHLATK